MGQSQFWVVVPAAGRGSRLGANTPKQFLDLGGKSVVERTLDRLLAHPRVLGVQLAVDPAERWWDALGFHPERVRFCGGGAERMDSVSAGLSALPQSCAPEHWVLVHDAARPLLSAFDLDRLFAALDEGADGAVLALPVSDSLKRAAADGAVVEHVPREGLWRALTPQAFRRAELTAALLRARSSGQVVTDESQAMLNVGVRARLVTGDPRNFKITTAADLELARALFTTGGT